MRAMGRNFLSVAEMKIRVPLSSWWVVRQEDASCRR